MTLWPLLRKDLLRELRGKTGLQAGLVVALLLVVVYLFAFPEGDVPANVAAAMVWTPLVYAGVAAAGRGIANEADGMTLDRLRMARIEPVWVGLSRTLTDAGITALVTAGACLAASLLFGFPTSATLIGVLALGVLGVAVIGSLAGGIAAQSRGRDILLPLLAVPLLAPLIQAGVSATAAAIEGVGASGLGSRILAMAGYDVLALAAGWMLWPFLLEADA